MSHVISAFEGGAWETRKQTFQTSRGEMADATEGPSLPHRQVPGPPRGPGSDALTAKGEAALPGQPSDAPWSTHMPWAPPPQADPRFQEEVSWTVSLLRANYSSENPPRRVAKQVCRRFGGEFLKRQCHIWTENLFYITLYMERRVKKQVTRTE